MNKTRDLGPVCERCYQDWIALVSDSLVLFVNWTKDKYKCWVEWQKRRIHWGLMPWWRVMPRGWLTFRSPFHNQQLFDWKWIWTVISFNNIISTSDLIYPSKTLFCSNFLGYLLLENLIELLRLSSEHRSWSWIHGEIICQNVIH